MSLNTIMLIIAAIAPALVLCIYVFKKDRVEKEPAGLLAKLFLFGALSSIPVFFVELILTKFINATFVNFFSIAVKEAPVSYLYVAVDMFIGVALVEEGFKWLTLVFFTKKSKEFNCLFDGMIYAIFVSLGFAALENILYVLNNGWVNAATRAILSVPGHMFFAVMMGYYYSRWHILTKARKGEEWLSENGYIKIKRGGFDYKRERNLSLLVPILFHGTYNFCCAVERTWALIAFLVFVVFMYVHCFKKLKQISRKDATNDAYVVALLMQKYPGLPAALKAREEVTEFK